MWPYGLCGVRQVHRLRSVPLPCLLNESCWRLRILTMRQCSFFLLCLHYTARRTPASVFSVCRLVTCAFFLVCLPIRSVSLGSLSVPGNAQQLGAIRAAELRRNCEALGVQWCELIDDTRLPDGVTHRWPADYIASLLRTHVDRLLITRLLTFDSHGVSGHANHIALWQAAQLLHTVPSAGGSLRSIHLLDSVPLWRKYLGVLDLLFVSAHCVGYVRLDGVLQVHAAMQRHRSQYVWFRRLSVLFSRYSVINTYTIAGRTESSDGRSL